MLFHGAVFRRLCCGMVGISLLMVGGCGFSWPFTSTSVESPPSPDEMKLYQQAVAAFQLKAYPEAAKSFETIRTTTSDKRFALMALYGLSFSKLMAAKTPEEYNNALMLWNRWVENVPVKFEHENPILANALIKEKMLFSNIPLTSRRSRAITMSGHPQAETPEPMVSRWLLIKSKEELDRLRSELESSKKMLEKRGRLIQARENEISELKRQIKALETIDQKIQKKKNAIPSADTAPQR